MSNCCVDDICQDDIKDGAKNARTVAKNVPETRLNLIREQLLTAKKQTAFIVSLPGDSKYQQYYKEHAKKDNHELDDVLHNSNHS